MNLHPALDLALQAASPSARFAVWKKLLNIRNTNFHLVLPEILPAKHQRFASELHYLLYLQKDSKHQRCCYTCGACANPPTPASRGSASEEQCRHCLQLVPRELERCAQSHCLQLVAASTGFLQLCLKMFF